ncbi:MAG: DUF11 domain-containing protein [Anaerolineae bacterium]|nr:DUF11 domain-containing protein [Anaerolineae bacterium]
MFSTTTVRAGQVTPLTWQMTFTNPTPLTITQLVVRDLLPVGLLYTEAETSHGTLAVTGRSAHGQDTRYVVLSSGSPAGQSATITPTQRITLSARIITPTVMASPTLSRTVLIHRATVTATTVATLTSPLTPTQQRLAEPSGVLPSPKDVPPTEVVFTIGDVPPGGRVTMLIHTLVLSDAVAGTTYDNKATFAAANLMPGASNPVRVTVAGSGWLPRVVLPVTGGLAALVDPRTPYGQVTWLLLLVTGLGTAGWLRRRRRLSGEFPQIDELKEDKYQQ